MTVQTRRGVQLAMKAALDRVVAAAGLVALSPVIALGAGAVWLSVGRPVFFRQERPGFLGRPFRIVKFRTMRDAVDANGKVLPDDARLTALGRVLRATSVDELPQLWNVLTGDLSLVGPRPLLMRYLDRYTPAQGRRHEVRPGITGWAQVNGRNALSWEEKFELDVWYVDNWSLWLDLRILALTALKVFKRDGISSSGHATMPEFFGTGAAAHDSKGDETR